MAFQFINYAGIPAQGNPALRNLAQSLMQGYQAARLPTQIGQEEKQRELANRLREMQVQYEPERQRLARQLTAAQIQKALRPAQPALSNIEKAIEGTERIKNQYGEDSAQYKAAQEYVQRLAQGNQGVTVTTDPVTGKPLVQIGGSSRGGRGTNLYQTDDDTVSFPTQATQTQLQKKLQASEILKNYLGKAKGLAEFQSPMTALSEFLQRYSNRFFGTDFQLPSEKAYAQSSLDTAVEPLLTELGLNVTDQSLNKVKSIIEPKPGESKKGYLNRIEKQIKDFAINEKIAQQKLSSGFRVPRSTSNEENKGKNQEQEKILRFNPATGRLE